MEGELVGVWFNGRWGRKTSRRIWLRRTPSGWEVQARQGDSDQPARCWDLPTEDLARALVEHLQEPAGDDANDGWREITSLYVTGPRSAAEPPPPGADPRRAPR